MFFSSQDILMAPVADVYWQLLWKVNISLKRKISLMILFSGGMFVIVAGLIRAVVVLTVRNPFG